MSQLQIFNHPDFGQVDVIEIDGKQWFGASQSAQALGYANPRKAIIDHCRQDGVTKRDTIDNLGRSQEMNFIDEGNLYRLITKSRLSGAEAFERWVFDEVLPTIRKTGSYSMMDPQQLIALALVEAQKVIENKDRQIAIMQPKAQFFDAVADSKSAIEFGKAAKVLAIRGFGRNNLFEFLRNEGVLMNGNIPKQRYVDAGYFRVIEQKWTDKNLETQISIKTLVYQKGLDWIRKLIEKQKANRTNG